MTPTASSELPTAHRAPANPAVAAPGLQGAFRLLLEHLGDHLDLLRIETGQELARFGSVIGCWFALALLLQLALALTLLLVIAVCWETDYRIHSVVLSAAVLLSGAGYCLWQLKRLGAKAALRFSASGQQIKRGLDLIREMI